MISPALASPPPRQNLSLGLSARTHSAHIYDTYHIVLEAEDRSSLQVFAGISVGRSCLSSGPASSLPRGFVACTPPPPAFVGPGQCLSHFFLEGKERALMRDMPGFSKHLKLSAPGGVMSQG